MRITILGGTRFIGRAVTEGLLTADHCVTLFHRGQTHAPFMPLPNVIRGDRDALADHAGALRASKPDAVVDFIVSNEAHVRLAHEVFRGCAGRYVLISSQDVYRAWTHVLHPDRMEELLPTPFDEDSPLREELYPCRDLYPESDWAGHYDKIPAERLALSADDLPGTVLRLPMVYGPHDPQHRTADALRRMLDGRAAILLDNPPGWRWHRGYVENVAGAILLAILDEHAAGQVYNVGEPEDQVLTLHQWVQAIGEVVGWTGEIVAPPGAPPMQDMVVSTDRIRRELGYAETVSFEEGLARTIEWQRAHWPETMTPDSLAETYAAEDAQLREWA